MFDFLNHFPDIKRKVLSYVSGVPELDTVMEHFYVDDFCRRMHDNLFGELLDYNPYRFLSTRGYVSTDMLDIQENYSYVSGVQVQKSAVLIMLLLTVPVVGATTTASIQDALTWDVLVGVFCGVLVSILFMYYKYVCKIILAIPAYYMLVVLRALYKYPACWWKLWRMRKMRYSCKSEQLYDEGIFEEEAVLVSIEKNLDGKIYHIVCGERRFVARFAPPTTQVEMSMPNSTYRDITEKPVGVFIQKNGDTHSVLGGFFRIENYLVTAGHVADVIYDGNSEFYYARVAKDSLSSKVKIVVDNMMLVKREDFSSDVNLSKSSVLDVHVVEKEDIFWAGAGVGKSTFAASCWNQPITSVGIRNSCLVGAPGVTSKHNNDYLLQHTASTAPGHSGFPLYQGKDIVAMHVMGVPTANQAVRIEFILRILPKKESNYQLNDVLVRGYRSLKGKLSTRGEFEDFVYGRDDEGHIDFLDESVEGETLFIDTGRKPFTPKNKDLTEVIAYLKTPSGRQHLKDFYDYEDIYAKYDDSPRGYPEHGGMRGNTLTYDDVDYYNNPHRIPVPKIRVDAVSVASSVSLGESPRSRRKRKRKIKEKNTKVERLDNYEILPDKGIAPMQVPKLSKEVPSVVQYFKRGDISMQLKNLGYDATKYQFPTFTNEVERLSLLKSLDLFGDRVKAIGVTSASKVNVSAVEIATRMLSMNRFVVRKGFKDRITLEGILNSSIVGDSKSAGYPYSCQKMINNEAVIRLMTPQGVVNRVVDEWDKPMICRVFNKGEPHKIEKIQKQMLRVIAGFPLHKLIKHAAVFYDAAETFNQNWSVSPMKHSYSPLVPYSNIHLYEYFKDEGELWETDKKNWDFNMFEKHYLMCALVIKRLAIKSPEMTDDEFDEWLDSVDSSVQEVMSADYILSDATIVRSTYKGIMKSGWFCTILFNTMSQLIHHIEVCLELGLSAEQILSSKIIAKGDDVLQKSLKEFAITSDQYAAASKKLGLEIDIKVNHSIKGSEFCSVILKPFGRGVAAIPVRFTKHIENLRRVSGGMISSALSSIMREWIWDDSKFSFFERMYLYMRSKSEQPDLEYPLMLIPVKASLRSELSGLEVGGANASKLHRSL